MNTQINQRSRWVSPLDRQGESLRRPAQALEARRAFQVAAGQEWEFGSRILSMLDERTLRRPEFQDGFSVQLADGQHWMLPKASSVPLASKGAEPESAFDQEYEAIIDAVVEAEDEAERRRAELAFLIALLARNYELAPEEFRQLLEFPKGSPESLALQSNVRAICREHVRAVLDRRRGQAEASSKRGSLMQAFWRRLRNRMVADSMS